MLYHKREELNKKHKEHEHTARKVECQTLKYFVSNEEADFSYYRYILIFKSYPTHTRTLNHGLLAAVI